jgi:hypothetical protein
MLTALLSLLAFGAGAPTHVLHGRVIGASRASVDGLVLKIGDYGQAVTRGGAFTVEIPAGVTSVDVTLVGSEWKVLVPPAGRIPVPLGDDPVTLLVGEPVEGIVLKALADWKRQLDESRARDVSGVEVLSGRLAEVLAKLGVQREEFEDEVKRRSRQAELYPAMNAYVLEARDLRGALVSLGPLIEKHPHEAYEALKQALGEYNAAYTRLSTRADGFGASIEEAWPDGKLARRDFDDFYRNAVDQPHQTQILPLNDQLVKVQAGLFSGRRDAEFKDAMTELRRRVDALSPVVALLGERAARELEKLRPAGS